MTLNVTATEIQVKNSLGSVKFTSNNKLVYLKKYQTGTVDVNANSTVYIPFDYLGPKDFLSMQVKFNTASGYPTLMNPIIGKNIPANGSFMVDFYGRNVGQQPAADCENFGVDVIMNVLWFKCIRFDNYGQMKAGTTNNNITYTARILSYL